MTPAHEHWHCEESSSAGTPPIVTSLEPGVHGARTGTQGCGVSVPEAALVAAATWGFAVDVHIPNGGTFDAATSLTTPAAPVAETSVPEAEKVAGVVPNEHCSVAPVHTWLGIMHLLQSLILRVRPRPFRRQAGLISPMPVRERVA